MEWLELIGFSGFYILVQNGINSGLGMLALYILSVVYDVVFIQVQPIIVWGCWLVGGDHSCHSRGQHR